jgi:HSP20 family protein
MSLVPFTDKHGDGDPRELAPFQELRREMGRLFDSFFRHPLFGEGDWNGGATWAPPLDVADGESEVTVRAELPGVDPKELEISVLGNTLTVAGEKKETSEKRDGDYFHREARYGSFRRTVTLPAGVTAENVKADYANGVLTVRLPKSPTEKPRRIPISAS